MDLSTSEQLAYSTVRIECEYEDGTNGTGTGFFFGFLENDETDQHIPVVITNKHVVKDPEHGDAKNGRLIITTATENNNPNDKEHFRVSYRNFRNFWRFHPNENVDLCAMPMAPFLRKAKEDGKKLFYRALNYKLIPSQLQLEQLSGLEEILMIGYPNGIWDYINNKPIYRKGVTATHPNFDYNGKKEFLIDAACFPGSSGSPVFLFNESSYRDKKGTTYIGERILLLGVLYAGPQYTASGEIKIIDVPVSQKPIVLSSIPNNLGIVIKAEEIKELEKQFEEKK
jgi:V8-like Glu-specific endopeptidase